MTPCIQVVKQCAYPANSPTCFPAGANIDFTGYVTNCGDIRLTNVAVVDSRPLLGLGLTDLGGFPLIQPLTLDPGQAIAFKGSYAPTLAETCAGSAANTITVRGTDITIIGGPFASVTNTATANCAICVNPCLQVTKECSPAVLGGPQTISGGITNCGNIAITNIVVSDNQYGAITTIPSLAPGAGTTYSKTFTASVCGTTVNIVTAAGTTACGAPIQARATNSCLVDCPPCIKVDKIVACAIGTNCGPFGEIAIGMKNAAATPPQNPTFCYSITVSNCGSTALTNNRVLDDKLGDLTASYFANPATSFPAGGTITRIFKATWANDTTNTVVANGQSILTGQSVSDTNNAVALVIPASVRCAMQASSPGDLDGNPNDGHVTLITDGAPHNVTFSVTITAGSAPLANVTIAAPTLAGLGCVLPPPFSLPANSNFTYVCIAPVNCTTIPTGGLTNVAVISAVVDTSGGLCGYDASGQLISVASSQAGDPCAVVIECRAVPKICVIKEVACELPAGCGPYSHLATGAKTADNSRGPSFGYRVRVTNCGQEALNNVTVVDNVLNLAACNFPTTLAVGQTVECTLAGVEHCNNVTNTVTASGVGASSGIGVSTHDRAAVVVLPIRITCEVTVNGKPEETIPCDGQGHLITNAVEVCNTGSLPLSDITINAPNIVALGAACTNVANLRLSLLPGQCTNLLLCIDMVTCPPDCSLAFSNHIRITATVDQTLTNFCSWTRNESNQLVAITASTECSAVVKCLPPPKAGCTPGFWKNGTIHWQPTGYRTEQTVRSVFSLGNCCTDLGNTSLLGALGFPGGSGVCGGARILLRAAVAALLNAWSSEVDYPFTAQEVLTSVNAALQSCDRATMIAWASELDRNNNLGCRDANGNDLPCHRLTGVPRITPTRE